MTFPYKSELVGEIKQIRQEFEDSYQTNPSDASAYFRNRIHGIQWDKRIRVSPENFKGLLVNLRVAANTTRDMTYSPKQMQAISHALELCGRYEELANEELYLGVEAMEQVGLDTSLSFGEKGAQAFLDALTEHRENR